MIYRRAKQEAADRIADGLTDQVERHRGRPGTNDDEPDGGLPAPWSRRAEGT